MIAYPIRERTIARVLEDKAARNGQKPYLFFEDRSYSYEEIEVQSNRIANALRETGVRAGVQVAVMMDNKPEALLAYFAIGKLGSVGVPLNTAAKGEMLAYFIAQSRSEWLIVDAMFAGRVKEVLPQLPRVKRVFIFDETRQTAAPAEFDGPVPAQDFRELLAGDGAPPPAAARYSDLWLILYTSGTTGRSKGNMSTHCHALTCGLELANAYGYRPDDVLYTCLPVFHGNAFLCSCLPALVADSAVALARRFSASAFWPDIRKYGATQFNSLGAMTNILWSRPAEPDDADNPVRQCMVVPAPPFYHAFEKRFDLKFTSVYALTDACIVTIARPDDAAGKWASAGQSCATNEVRVVDDEDFPLPACQVGEIVVRGREPWVMAQGYFDMPEATLVAQRNLWFHTGDRGYLDADGFLYFVDRKKDAIRRRGENVSSYEVEQIILKNPAVMDVAAYPVPSEHSEDEVMVSLVLREGQTLSPEELIDFCQRNMPYFMVPRFVEFLPELPKTMTEKVEKYKLRAAAVARLNEIWDREKAGIVVAR